MQAELLRFDKNQKYILFDLESCSLNLQHPSNKPWQVGFILGRGEYIQSLHCHYVKWPDLKVSPEASIVTHFSYEIYNCEAEDALKILNKFEQYLFDESYLIVGHNILGFDVYLHQIWRRLLGKPTDFSYINRCIDTNALAKATKLGISYNKKELLLAFQYRMLDRIEKGLKTRLEVLGKEYGIDFDKEKLHDAGNDVKLNWEVWNKLKYQIDI
jgi:DNA polymerase III epsilon subunit-like protein